jgi:putative FmdB family regulatory protein
MPTYVYACDTCGAQFEQFQSFKDEPLRTCRSCAGAVRRVFQPVGIVFKGSGWYITDSRKSDSASVTGDDSAGKSEKATADKSEKTTTTSDSTSKPESTSDTKSSSESKPVTV